MASTDRIGDWLGDWLADGCHYIEGYAELQNRKEGKLLWRIQVEKKTAQDLELEILDKFEPGGAYWIRAKRGDGTTAKRGRVIFRMPAEPDPAADKKQKFQPRKKGRTAAPKAEVPALAWGMVEAIGEQRKILRDAQNHSVALSSELLHIVTESISTRAELEAEAAAAMAAREISEARQKWGPDDWLLFLAGVAELAAPFVAPVSKAAAAVRARVDTWRGALDGQDEK